MTKGRSIRWWLRVGTAAVALQAAGALAAPTSIDLPAAEAADAVTAFARQSGYQVIAPQGDLAGIRTNAVKGELEPAEALRQMFAGTGVSVTETGSNAASLTRPAAQAPAAVAATTAGDETIIVTGSRIARAGFDTLQAAVVDDAAQLERRGYANVAQALEANPLFGLSDASAVGRNQPVNGTGQAFIDMFNLGSQRTLTLVNGRRFVSSNSAAAGGVSPGSQVDINLIPAGLVERVETIAIGGAPIYGSDAIAGTVNIILKDDFDGIEARAQYGIAETGDARRYRAGVIAGRNFADDRANVTLSLEHSSQDGLLYSDRFDGFASTVTNPANRSPTDGVSALVVVPDLRFGVLTEGGIPYFDSGAVRALRLDGPGLSLPALGIAPRGNYIFDAQGRPLQFSSGGDLVPFNVGTIVDNPLASLGGTLPLQTQGGDGFSLADHISLLAPTERTLANLLARFDVTPDVRLFVEGAYAKSSGKRLSDPSSFAAPALLGGPLLSFSVDNPYLTEATRGILRANGLTSFNLNRNLNDLVDRIPQKTELDLYRIVGGAEGGFDVGDERWTWNLAYNYGRSRNRSRITYVDRANLLAAANAVRDASGNIVCGPTPAAAAGAEPGCVPINLFGLGSFSAAAADYVTEQGRSRSLNTQQVLTANVGGRLPFGLASDPIAFNVGVEHRRESASFRPDDVLQAGNTLIGPGIGAFSGVKGKFNTDEAYGELVVPLVSDEQDWPVIRSAQLEGALRYVDNSVAGGATTWSAGGRLAPRLGGIGEGLLLRGVYTRSIRAPAITELFLGTSPVTEGITDPCDRNNFNRGANPAVRAANCAAALAAVGAVAPSSFTATTRSRSPSGTVSGNPDLDNERAKSWSAGFVFQPPALPGLRVAADWTDIRLTGGIQQLGLAQLMAACYDSTEFPGSTACSSFRRLSAADIAAGNGTGGVARQVGDVASGFATTYLNTSKLDFAGLIVSAEYGFGIGPVARSWNEGTAARLGVKLFYTDKYDLLPFAGQPVTEVAGAYSVPRYRVQANAGVSVGRLDADVQLLWRSSTKFDLTQTIEDTPVNAVGDYTLVNGTLGVRVTEALRAQFIVNNIFDRKVPYSAQARQNFGAYDVIGRNFVVTLAAGF